MGMAALKEPDEVLAAAPAFPSMAAAMQNVATLKADINRMIREYGANSRRWRSGAERAALNRRSEIRSILKGPDGRAMQAALLETQRSFVGGLDRMVASEANLFAAMRAAMAAQIDVLVLQDGMDVPFIKSVQTRAMNLLADMQDARVRIFYEEKAFLADLDPESRGGPAFDDVDDLITYLND